MAASQQNISSNTPMGANLIAGGATFRIWAPNALEVYVVLTSGVALSALPPASDFLLIKDANGHWMGFFPNLAKGQLYMYYVIGSVGSSLKRDPYARSLTMDNNALNWRCILEDPAFPWHDDSFKTPAFSDMIIYQAHVGSFYIPGPQVSGTFLDVVAKIPHLAGLGITVLQLLPIHEFNTSSSQGYNGCDLYSPEQLYTVTDANLPTYLTAVNQLLSAKQLQQYKLRDLTGGPAQLRVLIDICHCYGIAVIFDAVYHHCGPDFDDHDLSFLDMSAVAPDYNYSTYLTNNDFIGKVMDFSKPEVCDFLIRNAVSFVTEYHADGFRFDEISLLNATGEQPYAWQFSQNLTSTLKYVNPNLLLHAEYWDGEYWVSKTQVVVPAPAGLGFDTTLSDSQRNGIRKVIGAASQANDNPLDMYGLGKGLWQDGFPQEWQLVQGPENQDVTLLGHDNASRIAALSDPSDSRSWYATSRSRVAMGICLTAPGIPMMFMGQEFLEDQLWSDNFNLKQNLLNWSGLQTQKKMADFLLFTSTLIKLRWQYPALRGQGFAYTHNNNAARVLAYHRWIPGEGKDIMVVVHLGNNNAYNYRVGFPIAGSWKEAFNSDYFENCPNPNTCGNGGLVNTDNQAYDGFAYSAPLTLPANGVLVFSK